MIAIEYKWDNPKTNPDFKNGIPANIQGKKTLLNPTLFNGDFTKFTWITIPFSGEKGSNMRVLYSLKSMNELIDFSFESVCEDGVSQCNISLVRKGYPDYPMVGWGGKSADKRLRFDLVTGAVYVGRNGDQLIFQVEASKTYDNSSGQSYPQGIDAKNRLKVTDGTASIEAALTTSEQSYFEIGRAPVHSEPVIVNFSCKKSEQ